jgi:hypothetical protein
MKTRLAVARSLGRKTATVIIYFGMRHLGFNGTSAGKDVHMAEHDGQLSTLLYQALFHSRVWYLCDRAANAWTVYVILPVSLTNRSVTAQYALLVNILIVQSTMQGQSDSVVPMFTVSLLIRIFYAIVAGSLMLV